MGERFAGRYELVDHLGEGGVGSVWRAWDGRRGSYVAAKLLRQRDAGALLRFVREQSLRVVHPHVVAPTGWAAEDDDVLLTMDLVRGGSVAQLLGDYGRLPPAVVGVLLEQLLDALDAVHRADLVHRDVKPANLLLEPTGTDRPFLRLADFGIAVLGSDPRLTGTGFVVGTAGYVAPEVLRGAQPDPRQDLWSAGLVARQLLDGRTPLPGPRAAHRGLDELLQSLTADDPAARPADALAARRRLQALGPLPAGEEPVEVFDHLPPLPAGWTTDGPAGAAPPPPPGRVTAQLAEPTRRAPVATAPLPRDDPAPVPGDEPPPGRRRPPVGLVLRLVAALVLVLVAVYAFSRAHADGADPVPGPSGLPTTKADAGDACAFTDVGLSRASGGRQITCQAGAGGYTWVSG